MERSIRKPPRALLVTCIVLFMTGVVVGLWLAGLLWGS
jgi:hypothetical protein